MSRSAAALMVCILSTACLHPPAAPTATATSPVAMPVAAEPPPPAAVPATQPPAGPPARRAARRPRAYFFGQLPVLSKVLFYVRENHVDPQRMDFQRALLAALEGMQQAAPELQ